MRIIKFNLEKYSPYQSLAVDSLLIALLEDEGVKINAATAIEIQTILANSNIADNTFAKLKYKIAPILSRNKEEQDKIYQIFDELDAKILPPPPPPDPPKPLTFFQRIIQKVKANKIVATLILVGLLLPLAYFIYQKWSKPDEFMPIEFKIGLVGDTYISEPQTFTSFFGDSVLSQSLPVFDFDSIFNQKHSVDWIIDKKIYNNTFNPVVTFDSAKKYHAIAFLKNSENAIIDTANYSFEVWCERSPTVQIEKSSTYDKDIYKPIFTNISKESSKYTYLWTVNNKEYTGKTLTLPPKGEEEAREIELLVDASKAHCSTNEIKANLSESPKAMARIVPGNTPITLKKGINYENLLKNIFFLLVIPLAVGALIYNFLRNKNKKPTPELPKYQGTEGPYSIEFKNQDYLINADSELDSFIDKLRKRQLSELLKLNVKKTVKSAITTFGLTELFFNHQTKATDYVVLFDKEHNSSHLTFLFGYLIKKLQAEQINITVYEYYKEPTFVSSSKMNLLQVPIERVAAMHSDSTVLIFGDAKNFVFPIKKTVKPWVAKLNSWQTKILITPFAKNDWDIKERLVSEGNILIIPSDMNAQGNLDKVIFNKIDKQADLIIPDAYQARFLNLHTIEGLENYLEDKNLFNWACALAVYPYTDWNLTLAIGHAFEEKLKENDPQFSLVNYSNLLKMGRISWLHDSCWSDGLRVNMLEKLDDGIELLARKTVLNQLEAIKDSIGDNALIKREFDVHNNLNSFLVDVFEKNRVNSVKNEPNIRQMFELDHVDQGNEIYLKNANNTLIKDPKTNIGTISVDKYLERSAEIEDKNHLWRFYKSIFISISSVLILSMFSYEIIKNNTDWLAIQKTMPVDISFKITNGIKSNNYFSAAIKIDDENSTSFETLRKDTTIVLKNLIITDSTNKGAYYLSVGRNNTSQYLDSFKLNRTSYNLFLDPLDSANHIPLTVNYSSETDNDARTIMESFSDKYELNYEKTNTQIKDYEINYSNNKFEENANTIANILSTKLNKTIRATYLVDKGNHRQQSKVFITVKIPTTETEIPATLPQSLMEIWKGKTNNRKVTFNLQTNMFFYSTGADKTFGTYAIGSVTKLKSGTYKIVTKTKYVFLVRNVTKNGFEISSCFIKPYTDAEIAKLDESNCGSFDSMVLMDLKNTNSIIELPVKSADIKDYFSKNRSFLAVPTLSKGFEISIAFDYVRNPYLPDVYTSPLSNIIIGKDHKLTKNTKITTGNPFVRGRLNFKTVSSEILEPVNIGQNANQTDIKNNLDANNQIVAVAKNEIGYKEGKGNKNKYGAWFGIDNQPWSTIFVCWVYNTAGMKLGVTAKGMVASSKLLNDYANKAGLTTKNPVPGDIFTLSAKDFSHAGIFVKWINQQTGEFETIEGNSSVDGSNDGNAVVNTKRNINEVSTIFIHVNSTKKELKSAY
jgi:hypothetical protein